jgi:hypothetical protein
MVRGIKMHQNIFLKSVPRLITIPVRIVKGMKYHNFASNILKEKTGFSELIAHTKIQNKWSKRIMINGCERNPLGMISFLKTNTASVTNIRPAMSGSVGRSVANPLGK